MAPNHPMRYLEVIRPCGEKLVFRKMDNGQIACPVCGFVAPISSQTHRDDGLLGLPWEIQAEGEDAAPSLDCCPCCGVEHGYDDGGPSRKLNENWRSLRIEWLERVRWSDEAVRQLENLDIKADPKRKTLDESASAN